MLKNFPKNKTASRRKVIVISIITALFFALTPYVVSAAGPWVNTETAPSMNGTNYITPSSPALGVTRGVWEDARTNKDKVSWISRQLGSIFASYGASLELVFNALNITVDSVILGRQAGTPVKMGGIVSPFHFELISGNPYGYAGSVAYAILRQASLIFMAIVLMSQLARYAVNTTGTNMEALKEYFLGFSLVSILLYIMPQIVNYVIYLRFQLMHRFASGLLGASISAENFNLSDLFYGIFIEEPDIINGFLFTASIFYLVYLMALYIGNAMYCCVLFAVFPIIALFSIKNRGLLTAWLKAMLGTLIIPFIDGVLLIIPALCAAGFNQFDLYWSDGVNSSVFTPLAKGVFTLIMCMSITPMRRMVLAMLGLNGAGEGEIAGHKFWGSAGAGFSAAVAGIKAIASEGTSIASDAAAMRDQKNAESLDKDLAAKDGNGSAAKSNKKAADLKTDTASAMDEKFGKKEDQNQTSPKGDNKQVSNDSGPNLDKDISPEEGSSPQEPSKEDDGVLHDNSPSTDEQVEVGQSLPEQGTDTSIEGASSVEGQESGVIEGNERVENLQALNDADKDIQGYEDRIAQIEHGSIGADGAPDKDGRFWDDPKQVGNADTARYSNSALDNQIKDLKLENAKLDTQLANGEIGKDVHDKAHAANNEKIARLEQTKGKNDLEIGWNKSQITRARNDRENAMEKEKAFAAADKALGGSGKTYSSPAEMARQKEIDKIYAAHANHKNFDSAQFAGHLSSADRARLQRERTVAMRRELTGQHLTNAALAMGRVVGGSVGFAATAMTDNPMAGAQIGAQVGEVSAQAGLGVANTVRKVPANAMHLANVVSGSISDHRESQSQKAEEAAYVKRAVAEGIKSDKTLGNREKEAMVKKLSAEVHQKEEKASKLANSSENWGRKQDKIDRMDQWLANNYFFGNSNAAVRQSSRSQREATKPLDTASFTPKSSGYNADKIRQLVATETKRNSQSSKSIEDQMKHINEITKRAHIDDGYED